MFSLFNELGDAQRLAAKKFHVIFFAESRHYFQYFRYLFEELTAIPNLRIAYLTADKTDEILQDKRVEGYYLKNTLAGVFPRLQADVMIMTMPDLQNFIFKKSRSVKKYVYVFHALVSTHQQYRAHAFDHYDAVFCTGPQQVEEIRASEKFHNLPAKEIVCYGYPLLEEWKKKAAQTTLQEGKVLIAPSWYKEGILNTCVLPMLGCLQLTRHPTWIRPHPEFVKRNKKAYRRLLEMIEPTVHVHIDRSTSVVTHLLDAQFLVTDRSGIALEYAYATGRPVLFVDTPPKVQNAEWALLRLQPLENTYRHLLGMSILPEEVTDTNVFLQALENKTSAFNDSIEKAERETVFRPDDRQNGLTWIERNVSA